MLEHLWLEARDGNHAFYKGLIQLAGAFVHLQKQFQRPHHPKDGNRARPAVRLFLLAARNLAPYRPLHLRLNVESVWRLTTSLAEQITHSVFQPVVAGVRSCYSWTRVRFENRKSKDWAPKARHSCRSPSLNHCVLERSADSKFGSNSAFRICFPPRSSRQRPRSQFRARRS